MGFFDKVKTFVGSHGCTVEIAELERQAPGACQFPVGDSVFADVKGTPMDAEAKQPFTVVAA